MKPVLATRRLPGPALDRLPADVWDGDGPMPRDELLRRAAGRTGLITMLTDRVDGELLDAAGPGLRIVANYAAGHDNVDLAACRSRGVTVTNTPDVLTDATADATWTLLLAAARRVVEGDAVQRAGLPWACTRLPAGTPGLRRDPGRRRLREDRPRGRPAGGRIRHARPPPRPLRHTRTPPPLRRGPRRALPHGPRRVARTVRLRDRAPARDAGDTASLLGGTIRGDAAGRGLRQHLTRQRGRRPPSRTRSPRVTCTRRA